MVKIKKQTFTCDLRIKEIQYIYAITYKVKVKQLLINKNFKVKSGITLLKYLKKTWKQGKIYR